MKAGQNVDMGFAELAHFECVLEVLQGVERIGFAGEIGVTQPLKALELRFTLFETWCPDFCQLVRKMGFQKLEH